MPVYGCLLAGCVVALTSFNVKYAESLVFGVHGVDESVKEGLANAAAGVGIVFKKDRQDVSFKNVGA